jgi:TRAP-type C4-dicarboxylate transport system substrate-binding protein
MYRKWSIFIVTIVIIMGLLLVACPAPTTPSTPTTPATPATPSTPAAPKTLKLSYPMPEGIGAAVAYDWWAIEFPKATNGRYKVETYPAGALVAMPASLDSVKAGVVDIQMSSVSSFLKVFPLASVITLPTVAYPGSYEGNREAEISFWKLYNKFPEFADEFKEFKLVYMCAGGDPYAIVSKKKEVHKAEDFKGMRVGGSGGKLDFVTNYGGAGIVENPPDAYMNLDKGVTDACFLTTTHWAAYRIYEIADYFYAMDFGTSGMPLLMNLNTWNAISPEDQKICMDLWAEASDHMNKVLSPSFAVHRQEVIDAGKKVVDPTPEEITAWREAAQPVFDKYVADAKALGKTGGQEVLDEWIKLLNDWRAAQK